MHRAAGYGGRSKANPSTLCQKCLKRGHYSYECTVAAQERPYKPRPSRTQQLLNPKLKPKLTTEVPAELLPKKGLAGAISGKKEEERGRKGDRDSKRSRSVSTCSSDSVSTISTNRSPSRSPSAKRSGQEGKTVSRGADLKRRRRSISSDAYESGSSHRSRSRERNTRRRMSSFSPAERGRRRSRSGSSPMDITRDSGPRSGNGDRKPSRRRHHSRGQRRGRSRSRNRTSQSQRPVRPLSVSRSRSRSSNRMDTSDDRHPPHNSTAEPPKGRPAKSPVRRHTLSHSRSRSPGRGRWRSRSPHRRSPDPHSQRVAMRSPSPFRGPGGHPRDNHPYNGRSRQEQRPAEPPFKNAPPAPPPQPRERSLSPYSKRVAMTRQMQGGR